MDPGATEPKTTAVSGWPSPGSPRRRLQLVTEPWHQRRQDTRAFARRCPPSTAVGAASLALKWREASWPCPKGSNTATDVALRGSMHGDRPVFATKIGTAKAPPRRSRTTPMPSRRFALLHRGIPFAAEPPGAWVDRASPVEAALAEESPPATSQARGSREAIRHARRAAPPCPRPPGRRNFIRRSLTGPHLQRAPLQAAGPQGAGRVARPPGGRGAGGAGGPLVCSLLT